MQDTIEEIKEDCYKEVKEFCQDFLSSLTKKDINYRDYKNLSMEMAELISTLRFHKYHQRDAIPLLEKAMNELSGVNDKNRETE